MKKYTLYLALIMVILILASCKSEDNKLISEAAEMIQNSQNMEALELLDQALFINPDNTKAYYYKAKIYLALDREAEAEDNINKALADTEFDYTGKLFYEVGNEFYRRQSYAKAIVCYEAAIKNGMEYSSSYALKSDPSPGAETKWYRQFCFYFYFCANSFAYTGDCQNAYKYYNASINLASKGMRSGDILQEGVDVIFSSETSERKEFGAYVGSFYYSRGLISEKLEMHSESEQDIKQAEKLKFIEELILDLDMVFCAG